MTNRIPALSREQLKRDWPLLAVLALLFLLGAYFYPKLPERVPSHWNIHGEVDGYSSRFFGAFGLPLFALGLYILMLWMPSLDPKKTNYPRFSGAYDIIRWATIGIMALTHGMVLMAGMGIKIDAGKVIQPAVSLMLILIGNQMGRFKHNYFVGIKTPWTLANEEVWRKTHRMAGPIWVVGGLMSLLATWLPPPYNFGVMMAVVVVLSVIPMVYSYRLFKEMAADD
ncbi:MAG: DUF1648 domain-containing protein [Firmicutes bacterium]|jgi:uncharacterized membrane protein|nr:DUF1648 domain-containing protein [Bacillota bacterium]